MVIVQLTSAAANKLDTSCMGSSSCFCTKDTKASTDRLPLYSLLAGCPFINTFIVGYLVIWNLDAMEAEKKLLNYK